MLERRVPLISAPTPLHRLERMSERLGLDLWIKRDDLTGFAGGGNKGRKLEFLLADVVASGADTVVTGGSAQSNFIRQCGAACGMLGLDFHALAMHWPHPGPGRETRPPDWEPGGLSGNMLLDAWLGFQPSIVPDGSWFELYAAMEARAAELEAAGRRVYLMRSGGSTGVGALGFVAAVSELDSQFDAIVVASGSGSTQAGLGYALRRGGFRTRLVGISTDKEPEVMDDVVRVAQELDLILLGNENMSASDFEFHVEFAGQGYQVPTPESQAAIEVLARTEGIFLDPVYTSKAFAGLLALAEREEVGGRVLFWHTGGFPGLFVAGYEK